MEEENRSSAQRIAWIVAAIAAPALLILIVQSAAGGRRVHVVGAGPIAALSEADAPEGLAYALDVAPREAPARSVARVEAAIATWPDVVVLGLDASATADPAGSDAYRATLARLTAQAESALAVPVVLGPRAPEDASEALRAAVAREEAWWRLELCRAPGTRVCVAADDELAQAVAAGVREAQARHESWRASTQ